MSIARRLLGDGLSSHGAGGLCCWIDLARDGRRGLAPQLLVGAGAAELGALLVVEAIRDGADALVAPRSWFDGALPADLPDLVVAQVGFDDVEPRILDTIARRTALLVVGDAAPLIEGSGGLHVLCLPPARLGDLYLLEAAGWPCPPVLV